jgi:hypothetical protein
MNGQFQTSVALTSGNKAADVTFIGDWVEPGEVSDVLKKT